MDDASGGWNAIARDFIARRSPVIGVAAVRKWAAGIGIGGSILDLGCGHGFPISTALAEDGFHVHGVDASPELLAEFRRNVPNAEARCEAVETSTFFNRRFEGAIAIGLMFLLDEHSQRQLIRKVSMALHPCGPFLFTAPCQSVSWPDILTGRLSIGLGRKVYQAVLAENGFEVLDGFTDEGENYYYSARKVK